MSRGVAYSRTKTLCRALPSRRNKKSRQSCRHVKLTPATETGSRIQADVERVVRDKVQENPGSSGKVHQSGQQLRDKHQRKYARQHNGGEHSVPYNARKPHPIYKVVAISSKLWRWGGGGDVTVDSAKVRRTENAQSTHLPALSTLGFLAWSCKTQSNVYKKT